MPEETFLRRRGLVPGRLCHAARLGLQGCFVIAGGCALIAQFALCTANFAAAEEKLPKIIRTIPIRPDPDPSAVAAHPMAKSEVPHLLADNIQGFGPECGDHAHQVLIDDRLVWIDLAKRTQTQLSNDPTAQMMACSPDGRWAIIAIAGDVWKTDDCPVPGKGELPIVLLRDMIEGKRRVIGEGFLEFGRNPRGDVLLYRIEPYCGFPNDTRPWLRLPDGLQEFKAVSVGSLARDILKGVKGWADNGPVGAFSWLDSDRFVVQLAEHEATFMDASRGAIVAISQSKGTATKVEQLNPSKFQASWELAVPQIRNVASDEIVRNANCDLNDGGETIECNDKYLQRGKSEVQRFRPVRFCRDAHGGDAGLFCDESGPNPPIWARVRRGAFVYVVKTVNEDRGGVLTNRQELYVVDNDAGGYLQ